MALTQAFITFFQELAANNHREWFHANKKRYEAHVKKPFYALVDTMMERAAFDVPAKDAVFRINRDIRFSKDKRPYKNYVAAVISPKGRKDMQYPGLYIHIEADQIMIAGGCHMPDKDQLAKIRAAIVADPKRVERLLRDKTFVDTFGGLAKGDRNKILPKPFKAHGETIPLLFNKQYFYSRTYEGESYVLREDLADFLLSQGRIGADWNAFLTEAMYG